MSERQATICLAAAMLCSASLMACGPEIKPGSEVKTLRVLAVQKDKPYAKPGDQVEMRMLFHDGSDEARRRLDAEWVAGLERGRPFRNGPAEAWRPLQVLWLAGCVNPQGDLFFECFRQLAEAMQRLREPATDLTTLPEGFAIGADPTSFRAPIPADIISSRPPPPDPRQPRYGLAYVFFAICAGNFGMAPDAASGEVLPIACFDAKSGEQLGSRDFVAGYSAIYAYEDIENKNPKITDFEFNGGRLKSLSSCPGCLCLIDDDPSGNCLKRSPDIAVPCDPSSVTCVAACPDDGDPKCPEIPIRPVVSPDIAEPDDVARISHGHDLTEQMWINYYVDRGSVASAVRLLNDATTGWNDDHGTNFFAPKEPGPVNIWAVVHDSRGGVTWARATVVVQ